MFPNDQLLKLNCGCAEPRELCCSSHYHRTQNLPRFVHSPNKQFLEMGTNRELGSCSLGMAAHICSMAPDIFFGKAGSQGGITFNSISVWAVVVHFHHSVCHSLTQCVSTIHRCTVSKLQPGPESKVESSHPLC